MRFRLNDGTIGTMVPGHQVPECWGASNPDSDGDLWLQVDGEKAHRVVQPDQCERTDPVYGVHPSQQPMTHDQMVHALRVAGYGVCRPGDVQRPLSLFIDQLRAAKYTVLSPTDTVARARTLMAGLEAASDATGEGADSWLSGKYDECAVKAYAYLLEWARTVC